MQRVVSVAPTHDDINPYFAVADTLRSRFRELVLFPLAVGVLAVVASFFVAKKYSAEAVFAAADDLGGDLSGPLASLAEQFGLSAPGSAYSVYYFSQILQTRAVLAGVINDTLVTNGVKWSLMDELDIPADNSPTDRLEKTVRVAQKIIDVRVDDQSNLVTVRGVASTPARAETLLAALLRSVDAVITRSVQQGGSAERRFAEAQAADAASNLRVAENAYRQFLETNRSLSSSPTLQFEEGRLRRQVEMEQQLYVALTNQAATAKLREVRNTPTISIVQMPMASYKKASPRGSVWGIMGSLGAFTLMAAWLFVLRPMLPGRFGGADVRRTPVTSGGA